jgi:hypothetical protein
MVLYALINAGRRPIYDLKAVWYKVGTLQARISERVQRMRFIPRALSSGEMVAEVLSGSYPRIIDICRLYQL